MTFSKDIKNNLVDDDFESACGRIVDAIIHTNLEELTDNPRSLSNILRKAIKFTEFLNTDVSLPDEKVREWTNALANFALCVFILYQENQEQQED